MLAMMFVIMATLSPFAINKTGILDLVLVWFFGFGSLGFIIYLQFSHQLMWDDERILMRHGGFWRIFGGEWPETSIRIADIEGVVGGGKRLWRLCKSTLCHLII
jgi:1,4-dihydroxy-2-naphthoate octaprenyltransferase